MKLPSKVTSYNESVLSKLPLILDKLEKCDLPPFALYQIIRDDLVDVPEYIDALDCLFALKKIEFKDAEGVMHYVV